MNRLCASFCFVYVCQRSVLCRARSALDLWPPPPPPAVCIVTHRPHITHRTPAQAHRQTQGRGEQHAAEDGISRKLVGRLLFHFLPARVLTPANLRRVRAVRKLLFAVTVSHFITARTVVGGSRGGVARNSLRCGYCLRAGGHSERCLPSVVLRCSAGGARCPSVSVRSVRHVTEVRWSVPYRKADWPGSRG